MSALAWSDVSIPTENPTKKSSPLSSNQPSSKLDLATIDLDFYDAKLADKTATQIVEWVAKHAKNPILTTNFRPQTSALLHLVTQVMPDIPVIWVDTGFNSDPTLEFAEKLTQKLNLNLKVYHPEQTAELEAFRKNGIPMPDDVEAHARFSRLVKLDPFEQALADYTPDAWITGIRREQNEFRESLDVLSRSEGGILKVAPMFYWSKQDQLDYIANHNLPDEHRYFDPTKLDESRECGLHTQL